MSQLMHVFYFIFFMKIVYADGTPIDPDAAKPEFREFHNRIWTGEISLKGNEARLQYAWAHMQQLSRNLKLKRFEESMRIVSKDRR